ncbi:MAG: HYR domain-containing protein, partial [Pyrinomonadaceae bacterium]
MTPAPRRSSTRPICNPAPGSAGRAKRLDAGLARLCAFAVMFGLLAAGVYTAASASSSRLFAGARRAAAAEAEAGTKSAPNRRPGARRRTAAAPAAPVAGLLPAMLFQAGETITTYESDCTTPSDLFELGDTVCAKVTGAQLGAGGFAARRVNWAARTGSIVQASDVTSAEQSFSFTLPSSETSIITDAGGGTVGEGPGTVVVDNRGVWKVYISDAAEASFRTGATFTVVAPTPYVDLQLSQSAAVQNSGVSAGSSSTFEIFLTNAGPNAAANVKVSDILPADATFVSLGESTGVGFACTPPAAAGDPAECTVASMPAGASARLVLAYSVNGGTAAGTVLTNSVSVASDTPELEPGDNSASFDAAVPTAAGAQTCSLTCHEDMVVTANTSQGGNSGAFVAFGAATGAGNCGAISSTPASGAFFPLGATVVSVSSETGSGSCSFTVTVVDTAAPTISCPADKTAPADANGIATVDPGTPTTNPATGVSVAGVRSDGEALNAPYPTGLTLITWTVTDSFGRTASCNQRVNVVDGACAGDTTAPTITAPANITVGTGADGTGCSVGLDDSELGQPDVNDDCPASVTVTHSTPPGGAYPVGTTTVTWTATDAAGNSATATQTVTVVDDTKPIIVAPADATYTCLSAVPAAHPSQATRGTVLDENGDPLPPGPPFDNCGVPVVTVTETSTGAGSAASPRVITRTFKATDAAGNFSTAVQTITVTDAVAPTLGVPADITVGNDAGSCSAAVSFSVTASDNCNADGVTVQTSHASGSVFPKGTTTVTATATDWAGNVTTKTFNVTVNDTEAPTISYPTGGVTVYLPLNSPATSTTATYTVTAADNCPGVTLSVSPASGSVFNVGATTVTATATDASGNTTVRTFTVTVLYNFTGFFSPVSNIPTLNKANGGQNIPIKFSLSGNKGLGIFAAGYPASQQVSCSDNAPVNNLEEAE